GDGHEQLFDLEADPRALHHLAADPAHAEELVRHRRWLAEALRGREAGYVDGDRLVAGRTPQSEAPWVQGHALLWPCSPRRVPRQPRRRIRSLRRSAAGTDGWCWAARWCGRRWSRWCSSPSAPSCRAWCWPSAR